MFEWLLMSPLSMWIDISPWAYPFLLTVHGLGMAVVVGITAVVALRILGFPARVPLGSYKGLMGLLWWGFLFNFLSGLALFIHDAVALAGNLSFQIKVISLIIGVVILWLMQAKVLAPAARAETAGAAPFVVNNSAKAIALAAILIWWLSVIVSGRLVAYLAAAV